MRDRSILRFWGTACLAMGLGILAALAVHAGELQVLTVLGRPVPTPRDASHAAQLTVLGRTEAPAPAGNALRVVTVWTRANCAPCDKFKADLKAGKLKGFDWQVEAAPAGEPVPQFRVIDAEGREYVRKGYGEPDELLKWARAKHGSGEVRTVPGGIVRSVPGISVPALSRADRGPPGS